MGDLEKQVEVNGRKEEEEEEEEKLLMEGMSVLDFDMLCSTVAMQTQGKNWSHIESNKEEEVGDLLHYNNGGGGGGFRMWEGEVLDCFDDRRIAIESLCCPCYRFGKNMRRTGFGSCFLQGVVYYALAFSALLSFVVFIVTKRHYFLYFSIAFTFFIGMYLGFFRRQMKKKFNIRGSDSSLDGCVYHLICSCCSLSQESRTLEMNNVQDGIWHGRGDTICVRSNSEGNKVFLELHPPSAVATKSPDICSMQKSTDLSDQSSTRGAWAFMTLISASTPILFIRSHERAAWSICCLSLERCLFKSRKMACSRVSDKEDVPSPCGQLRLAFNKSFVIG